MKGMTDDPTFLKEHYNLDVKSITEIKGGVVNSNFLVVSREGNYVWKIYNLKTKEEVRFEIDLLLLLSKTDFPSPRLLRGHDGVVLQEYDHKPCIVYKYIEGSNPDSETAEIVHTIGECLGKLHALTEDYKPTAKKKPWDPLDLARLVEDDQEKIVKKYQNGKSLLKFVVEELHKYTFPETLPKGITHQDTKPENIILLGGKVKGVIDFDNSYYGVLLHDITTAVMWFCFTNGRLNLEFLKQFLAGYSSHRKLTEEEKHYFLDSLKFRLVREVFIGPYAAKRSLSVVEKRAQHFMELYKNTTQLQKKDIMSITNP